MDNTRTYVLGDLFSILFPKKDLTVFEPQEMINFFTEALRRYENFLGVYTTTLEKLAEAIYLLQKDPQIASDISYRSKLTRLYNLIVDYSHTNNIHYGDLEGWKEAVEFFVQRQTKELGDEGSDINGQEL